MENTWENNNTLNALNDEMIKALTKEAKETPEYQEVYAKKREIDARARSAYLNGHRATYKKRAEISKQYKAEMEAIVNKYIDEHRNA